MSSDEETLQRQLGVLSLDPVIPHAPIPSTKEDPAIARGFTYDYRLAFAEHTMTSVPAYPCGMKTHSCVDMSPTKWAAVLCEWAPSGVPDYKDPVRALTLRASSYTEFDLIRMARLHFGVWKRLPDPLLWVYGIVPVDTYVHLSDTCSGMVAFCDRKKPGKEIVTTLGRFLSKFCEISLPDKVIQSASQDLRVITKATELTKYTVCHGGSPADFYNAYTSEVQSCMRPSKILATPHPAVAYASGDFEMYWAMDEQGKIKARAVVCTKNSSFWSVYPKSSNGLPSSEAGEFLYNHLITLGLKRTPEWASAASLVLVKVDEQETYSSEGRTAYSIPHVDGSTGVYAVRDLKGALVKFMIDPGMDPAGYTCSKQELTANLHCLDFVVAANANEPQLGLCPNDPQTLLLGA